MDWFLAQADFATDVAAGKLAPVTIVEASDVQGVLSPDEGPPGDVDVGQDFVAGTIAAVMNSQFWKSSVIFISYDENGGMYDHVVPPKACAPDAMPPDNGGTVGFDQYGFRVPLIVVSPYAKRGYISHAVTDATSILRFVEARFDLPAMTGARRQRRPDVRHVRLRAPRLQRAVVAGGHDRSGEARRLHEVTNEGATGGSRASCGPVPARPVPPTVARRRAARSAASSAIFVEWKLAPAALAMPQLDCADVDRRHRRRRCNRSLL